MFFRFLISLVCLSLLACSPQVDEVSIPVSANEPVAEISVPPSFDSQRAALVARAGAPLLDGLGDFEHAITTADAGAQLYFNQGMVMASGFNHAEAVRAFQAAQRLDPLCAMCFWGEALARGPNINVTSKGKAIMMPAERLAAFAAIQKAQQLSVDASEVERDYIRAQAFRFNGEPDTSREPLDLAYADAMRELAAKYPDDDDAQAIFAESMMNTMPWDYWVDGDNPRPETAEVIAVLETVMARNPRHALALHLYIHAVEASSRPGRAESAADALANLVPGSGHLVHMPSHIYWRVGRYFDASEANVKAAQVDEDYIAQCNAQGFYPAMYYPHNIHFLWASASMEGRSAVALEAGRKVAANVRIEQIVEFPTVEFFHTIPLLTLTRFGRWDEILLQAQPDMALKFSNAIWHYTRAIALLRKGDAEAAQVEVDAMVPLVNHPAIFSLDGNDYPASQILSIANLLARGELAQLAGDESAATTLLTEAVATQDRLPYTEPPFWYYPTRQTLGQVQLNAGNFAAAEAVYRRDLEQYPRNGWSLYGLSVALQGQGKSSEASSVRAKFENIWSRSDVTLTSSVL